jgi:hypothetical protein
MRLAGFVAFEANHGKNKKLKRSRTRVKILFRNGRTRLLTRSLKFDERLHQAPQTTKMISLSCLGNSMVGY